MFGVALRRDTLRGPKKKGRKAFAQRIKKTKRVIEKGREEHMYIPTRLDDLNSRLANG